MKYLFPVMTFIFITIVSITCSGGSSAKTAASPSATATVSSVSSPQVQKPGLYNADGTVHAVPISHSVTGTTIDVTQAPYNADKTGVTDARQAIEDAMSAAKSGDELYFPNGTYFLASAWVSDPKSNIRIKTGVNLRGQSQAGTILKTSFNDVYVENTNKTGSNSMYVIRGTGVHDVTISNMTITSIWSGAYSTDTVNNVASHGGPDICILFNASSTAYSYNIVIENVTVEKYLNIGIKMDKGCYDTLIKKCTAQNATDVGGGGCGYGFQLSGLNDNSLDNLATYANPNINTLNDNYFNTIDSCTTGNQYVRHAALIQYWAHNNQVLNCTFTATRLDSIDLHGEDEYLNEIMYNTISDSKNDSAVGLGNSGGTSVVHDKSGSYNYIHHNTITNCKRGVTVQYGTPNTIIENNTIQLCSVTNGIGISLGFAPSTIVRNNIIKNNGASGFKGIYFYKDAAEGNSAAGSPLGCTISGNSITDNTNGTAIYVSAQGAGNVFSGNTATGNADNTIP
jgi:large repetitive protein